MTDEALGMDGLGTDPAEPDQAEAAEVVSAARREAVARELLLLRILADQVETEKDARRLHLARDGVPGASWEGVTDAGEFAGEVRIDRGALTVRVTDPDEFEAWVTDHHPGQLVTYPATSNAVTADTALREALAEACLVHAEELAHTGPFSDQLAEVFLTELGLHGFTLTKLETARGYTAPASEFTTAVLEACRKAEKAEYRGVPVAGVTVTRAPAVPKVIPVKDRAVLAEFVRDRAADVAAIVTPAVEAGP